MKKFIQASAVSGICLSLPQAKPIKMSPKNGSARLRTSIIADGLRPTPALDLLGAALHSSKRQNDLLEGLDLEAPASVLCVPRHRRAGAIARAAGAAGAHDPFRAPPSGQASRQPPP